MGILDRFQKVVQASVHELMADGADPETLLAGAIDEMDRELQQARLSLKDSERRAEEAQQRAKLRQQEADGFQKRAQEAKTAGRPQAASQLDGFAQKAATAASSLTTE